MPLAGEVVERRQEEGPLAGAVFAPTEGRGAVEALPGLGGEPRNGGAKDGVQLWRGHEVTTATSPTLRRCVVPEPWL